MRATKLHTKGDEYMSEKEWLDRFGDNLLRIMKEKGFSVVSLSEEANIHKTTIYRYLKKEIMPNVKNLTKLSYTLGCSFDRLMDYGDVIEY